MSGLKINILKLKFLYFIMLLFKYIKNSNEKKNYLFLCLFVDYPKKKKSMTTSSLPNSSSILQGTRAW